MAEKYTPTEKWVADGCVVEPFDAPLSPDICATHADAIWTPTDDKSIAEANAVRIAKAVNSHEVLVAAMRQVRESHRALAIKANFNDCGCDDCLVIEPALKLAEG